MTTPRSIRSGAFALVICFAAFAGSCSQSSPENSPTTQVSIPSSAASPTITAVLPHSMDPSIGAVTGGSPVIKSAKVKVSDSCVDGRALVTVTSEVAAAPPIRVMTLIAGGAQTAINPVAGQELIIQSGSLPCDGSSTMLLVIATDFEARSSTQAVAAKSPLVP